MPPSSTTAAPQPSCAAGARPWHPLGDEAPPAPPRRSWPRLHRSGLWARTPREPRRRLPRAGRRWRRAAASAPRPRNAQAAAAPQDAPARPQRSRRHLLMWLLLRRQPRCRCERRHSETRHTRGHNNDGTARSANISAGNDHRPAATIHRRIVGSLSVAELSEAPTGRRQVCASMTAASAAGDGSGRADDDNGAPGAAAAHIWAVSDPLAVLLYGSLARAAATSDYDIAAVYTDRACPTRRHIEIPEHHQRTLRRGCAHLSVAAFDAPQRQDPCAVPGGDIAA